MSRAIFLDRDGVINEKAPEGSYITTAEEFVFIPGALEAIALLSKTNHKIIIVTNQQCIELGLLTTKNLDRIHSKMLEMITSHKGHIDSIYYCPHKSGTCTCRKPHPGMLDKAAFDENISLKDSWLIGDSQADILAGKSRGCRTIYLGNDPSTIALADLQAPSLLDAVHLILQSS